MERGDGFSHQVVVGALVNFARDDLGHEFENDLANPRRGVIDRVLARGGDFALGGGDDAVVLELRATGSFGL